MADTNYSQEHLDRVKSVLAGAPGDNDSKAAAWNAYFDSPDPAAFKQKFDAIPGIDKKAKAALFDSKFNSDVAEPAAISGAPPEPPLKVAAPLIPPMPLRVPKDIVQELPTVTGRIGEFLSNTGQVQGLEGANGTVSKELQGQLAKSASEPLIPLSSYLPENQPILGSTKLGKFVGGAAQGAEQLTTPAAIGGIGAAALVSGATAGTAIPAIMHSVFFGTAATGAAAHFGKGAYEAVANGDYDAAAKEMGFASVDALGAALIGKGGKLKSEGVTDPQKASEAIRLMREAQSGTGPSLEEAGLSIPETVPPEAAPAPSAAPPEPPVTGGASAAPPEPPPAPAAPVESGPIETATDTQGRQVQTQTLTQPAEAPPVPPGLLDKIVSGEQPPIDLDSVIRATTGEAPPVPPEKPSPLEAAVEATPQQQPTAPPAQLEPHQAQHVWSVFYGDQGAASQDDIAEMQRQYASNPSTREAIDQVLSEHPAPAASEAVPSMPVSAAQPPQDTDTTDEEGGADTAPEEDESPEEQHQAATSPDTISAGREGTTRTIKGTKAKFRYEVVDADNIKTSFEKDYNQDLQPRDTNRAGSAVRIQETAAKLDPTLLAESPLASDGAPITGPDDNHVEAGNHRVEAIRTAYQSIPAKAAAYKADLVERAGEFGLDPAAIAGAGKPVLIRRRIEQFEPAARRRFVEEANERSTAAMSPIEQAKIDAERLSPDMMAKFVPHEEGKIDHAENLPFIQDFMSGVVGTQAAGGLQTGNGGVNKAGVDRIRNAIFAKAYGAGSGSLDAMAEDPNPNIKNVVNGMLQAAPQMASMRDDMAGGILHDLDLSQDFSDAADKFSYLRDLMGGGISPEAKMIISSFDRFSRSGKGVAAVIQNYVKGVRAAGNPLQGGLFGPGEPPPTKTELIEAAIAVTEEEAKNAKPVKQRPAEKPADSGEPVRAEQPAERSGEVDAGDAAGSTDKAAAVESPASAGSTRREEPERDAEQSKQPERAPSQQSERAAGPPEAPARKPEVAAQREAGSKAASVEGSAPPEPPKKKPAAKKEEQLSGLSPAEQEKNNQTDKDKLAKERMQAEFKSPINQGNPPVDSGPLFTGKAESSEPKGQTDMFAEAPPTPPKKAQPKSEPEAAPSKEDKQPKHDFSSTQFNLPKDLADDVRKLGLEIADEDLYSTDYGTDSTDGREKDIHVTVKYGLHDDTPENVRKIAKGFGDIEIKLGKVSVFENPEFDVVKVGVDSPGLHKLNGLISGGIEHTDTFPDYEPHVTIAYVKPGLGKKYADQFNKTDSLKGELAYVRKLVFSDKNGEKTIINIEAKPSEPPIPPSAASTTGEKTATGDTPPTPPRRKPEANGSTKTGEGRLRQAPEDVPESRAGGQRDAGSVDSAKTDKRTDGVSAGEDLGRNGAGRTSGRIGEPGPEVKVSESAGGPEGVRPTRKPTIITVGNPPTLDTSKVPQPKDFTLFPHQEQAIAAGIKAMSEGDRGFLNAGGTGSGKSAQATAVTRHFLDQGKAVLLVAPAEVMKFKDTKSAMPQSSYKDWFNQYDLKPIRYQSGMSMEPGKFYVSTYSGFQDAPVDSGVVMVLDESHALKNVNSSQRGKSGVDLIEKAHAVLLMTATPVDQPNHIEYLKRVGILEGKSVANALQDLGMHLVEKKAKIPKDWDPTTGEKLPESTFFWAVDPKIGTKEVRNRFLGVFSRLIEQGKMRKEEIALDAMDIKVEEVQLPPEAEEVSQLIQEQLAGRTDVKNMLMHLRRQQEPFKIPAVLESIQREMKEGRKVVVFVNRVNKSDVTWTEKIKNQYGEVIDEVEHLVHSSEGTAKTLKAELDKLGIKAAEIHGGAEDSSAEGMRKFQADEADVVIATAPSGGTGIDLDDKKGDKPRTILVMTPEFDAMNSVQMIGRIYRMSTKSDARVRFMFADTETDRWNARKLSGKIKTLSSVVQGESSKMDVASSFFPENEEDDRPSIIGPRKGGNNVNKKRDKYKSYMESLNSRAVDVTRKIGIPTAMTLVRQWITKGNNVAYLSKKQVNELRQSLERESSQAIPLIIQQDRLRMGGISLFIDPKSGSGMLSVKE